MGDEVAGSGHPFFRWDINFAFCWSAGVLMMNGGSAEIDWTVAFF